MLKVAEGLYTRLSELEERLGSSSAGLTEMAQQVAEAKREIATVAADLQKTKDVIDLADIEERLAEEFGLSADGSGERGEG